MTTLSSLCDLIVDCEHRTAPTTADGYPLIRTPDVGVGRLQIENAQRVDEATYRAWTQRAVPQAGDLILAREAPVGNVGIVQPGVQPVLGQRTVLIRPRSDVLDSYYLNYLMSGPELRGWMEGVSTGATVPHLNMSDIRSMDLPPLPPISSQRKIGAVLSAYDDLIENNNRRIKLLEEIAQRIYREWFVDFRYPGHEDVPWVDSEMGPIPQGWHVRQLEEVANVNRGLSWDREQEVESGGLTIITIPNVQTRLQFGGMTQLSGVSAPNVERYSLAHGDTVLVGSNGNPERVGQAVWIPRGADMLFASFLMRVRSDPSVIGSSVLHMQLKDPRLTRAWRSSAIGSTSLRNIRLTTLRASSVLIPDVAVHTRAEAVLRGLLDLQDALDGASEVIRATRDLLLPPLFSGEIDVTDLDIAMSDAAA